MDTRVNQSIIIIYQSQEKQGIRIDSINSIIILLSPLYLWICITGVITIYSLTLLMTTLFSKVIHDNNNLPSPEETHSPNSRRILWLRDRPLECCCYFILNRIWSVNRSMSLSHFHYLRLLRLIAGCKVRRWRHFRIFYFGLYWMIFLMYFWGGLVAQRMIILFFFIHSLSSDLMQINTLSTPSLPPSLSP